MQIFLLGEEWLLFWCSLSFFDDLCVLILFDNKAVATLIPTLVAIAHGRLSQACCCKMPTPKQDFETTCLSAI